MLPPFLRNILGRIQTEVLQFCAPSRYERIVTQRAELETLERGDYYNRFYEAMDFEPSQDVIHAWARRMKAVAPNSPQGWMAMTEFYLKSENNIAALQNIEAALNKCDINLVCGKRMRGECYLLYHYALLRNEEVEEAAQVRTLMERRYPDIIQRAKENCRYRGWPKESLYLSEWGGEPPPQPRRAQFLAPISSPKFARESRYRSV